MITSGHMEARAFLETYSQSYAIDSEACTALPAQMWSLARPCPSALFLCCLGLLDETVVRQADRMRVLAPPTELPCPHLAKLHSSWPHHGGSARRPVASLHAGATSLPHRKASSSKKARRKAAAVKASAATQEAPRADSASRISFKVGDHEVRALVSLLSRLCLFCKGHVEAVHDPRRS